SSADRDTGGRWHPGRRLRRDTTDGADAQHDRPESVSPGDRVPRGLDDSSRARHTMALTGSGANTPPSVAIRLVERAVGRVLFWGGLTSIALLIFGLVLYAITGSYKAHAQEIEQLRHARMDRPA